MRTLWLSFDLRKIVSSSILALGFLYAFATEKDSLLIRSTTGKQISSEINIGSLRDFSSFQEFDDIGLEVDDPSDAEFFQDVSVSQHIANTRAKAKAVLDEVKQAQRYVEYLDEQSLLELPVGIKKEISNLEYTILIDSITLKPDGAYLTVYMALDVPNYEQTIAFKGTGIKFSKKGGIAQGEGSISLVGNYFIPFNDQTVLVLKEEDTSVSFDCDGFQKLSLDAEVVFSRELIVPENEDGSIGSDRVKASFKTTLSNWNDFLVEISLPRFQITTIPGFGFTISGAVFDFSDLKNATSIAFPENYLSGSGYEDNTSFWRGFYLREAVVALPPHFDKKGSNSRTSFTGRNMIIDQSGFTGYLEAENLITREEGDLQGWSFSLSKFFLDIQSGQLERGGFEGDIVLPITKDNQAFDYTAIISSNSVYQLVVAMQDTLDFPVFKTSKVELYPNSSVEIKLRDGKFLPKANLYGNMDIAAPMGKKEASLAAIDFENLQLQTESPLLKIDYFSFGSELAQQAVAGFPVQITDISFRNLSDQKTSLNFDLDINVTEVFAGGTGLSLKGAFAGGDRTRWVYDKISVDEISLSLSSAAFDFNGSLIFYHEDPVYGDGFAGQLMANFKPINLTIEAKAIFGNVEGFRYWYADAAGRFSPGIQLAPGLELTGFGGGAYYRMGVSKGSTSAIGMTPTGVVYEPKSNAGLGLKASVMFSVTGGAAFNGEAALEIAFFKGGGLRYVAYKGNAYFMASPMDNTLAAIKEKAQQVGAVVEKMENAAGGAIDSDLICKNKEEDQSLNQIYGDIGNAAGKRGAISAHVFIELNFEEKSLYGSFETYINVAGGIIKGTGAGGRAGWAELYFSPGDWYIYVGTPMDRMGLKVGIGPLSLKTEAYFIMGTSIPGSPPPPEEVSDILGGIDLDYMEELNVLGNGAGIGFGASFSMDTGDLTFLMFYARFKAGAGYDVMLKNYGNVSCVGRSGTIGINGWYANGQAYAYFDGEIGIRVKIFGRRKSVTILQIGAAAILQAKLPNPFWMRGIVGGRFRVLGGLVKGNCRFEVTIGTECEIKGNILESITVISDMSPAEGTSDVSVFGTPQGVFNLAVNTEFELVDQDEKLKKFKAEVDYFRILDKKASLTGSVELNADNTVAIFNSFDILPPKKKLRAEIQVSFREFVNGKWQTVVVDGKKYIEYKRVTFTTGEAPDHIPLSNVAYCYPVVNQLNFHKKESNTGYIQLKRGQPYLFDLSAQWVQKGRFVEIRSARPYYFDFNYSSANREVTFNIPNIPNDQVYAFELVNLPTQKAQSIDRNIQSDSSRVLADNATKIVAKEAKGNIAQLQEKRIFETNFRSSTFDTFREKMRALAITRTSREIAFLWEGLYLNNNITSSELFATEEIAGNEFTGNLPLVQFEAVITGNNYFENSINPVIYSGYPLPRGIRITNRNTDSLGVVPVRAVRVLQEDNLRLSPDDVEIGTYTYDQQQFRLIYFLAPYMYFDFLDLQAQAVNKYIQDTIIPERINRLIWSQFPLHNYGRYNIKAFYRLPGKGSPNSPLTLKTNYNE